jgi:hypothetical protein
MGFTWLSGLFGQPHALIFECNSETPDADYPKSWRREIPISGRGGQVWDPAFKFFAEGMLAVGGGWGYNVRNFKSELWENFMIKRS